MSSYQFTPQSVEDLFEIWNYIAGDDSEAASRVEEAIYAACAFLADTPLAGRIRADLTSLPLRFWRVQTYRNYWIVYHRETKPLQVIRISHAARAILGHGGIRLQKPRWLGPACRIIRCFPAQRQPRQRARRGSCQLPPRRSCRFRSNL